MPNPGQSGRTAGRCCNGSARKMPLLFFALRRHAPMAAGDCSSCANARRRAPATTSSRSCGSAPIAAIRCSNCAATPASATTSARKASCTSIRRRRIRRRPRAPAEQMRALGCDRQVISADEAVKIEPALAHIRPQLAGDVHGRGRVRRCQPLRTRTREPGNSGRRQVPHEPHGDGAARSRRQHDHVEATDNEGRFQRIRGDASCWRWAR